MVYLKRRLWFADKDGQHWLDQDDLLARGEPVVVLGEPGMGKTELLSTIGHEDGNAFCRATQLINRTRPATLIGNTTRLVIDALDEVAAQRQGDGVDLVLQKLGELDYPPFILSCRVAEWRSALATHAIADQYQVAPLEVHLEPLNRDEQLWLLTELTGDAETATALRDHFAAFGPEFLGNPQTLELIATLRTDALPETTTALFEQAIETLRGERNELKQEMQRNAALDAAGAAFAGLILSGNARIADKPSRQIKPGDKALPLAEVEAFDNHQVRRAADTKLFAADTEGLTYAHRRVGEFVGARWLAARADARTKHRRMLELFKSHGLIPASLRGLHAWLAQDPRLADSVIDADPMGIIEYGDAEALTTGQARRLFAALERLAADNPRFMDWREYRAGSLVIPPLMAEVERVIRDRAADFGLRLLLLQQLEYAPTAENLRDVLRALTLDGAEPYGLRQPSATALLALGGEDWPALLEQLRCQAREDSLRLAHELLDDIGTSNLSDEQIVAIVLARDGLSLCPIKAEPDRNMVKGFHRLAKDVPVERVDGLLDLLANYLIALLPEHAGFEENDLFDFAYALILKRVEQGGPVDPLDLWRWLRPLGEQTGYRRDRSRTVAEWIGAHDDVRRAIQRHVMLVEAGNADLWRRAMQLARTGSGLGLQQGDVIALLGALDPADRQDERWREIMTYGQTWGEEGRPLRDAAKPFAAHRPDLLEWIENKSERPVPEWERKREEKLRQHKAKQAARHAEHRQNFLAKMDGMRAGDYGLVLPPAQAYLKRFQDIGDAVPAHERVAEWLGDDIAAAAHQGLDAFLLAEPPVPDAETIAESYAESRRWPAGDIIVAALAERVRNRPVPFEDLNDERLMAGLFECWHGTIDGHAGIKELGPLIEAELKRRGAWEKAVKLFIEPQLRNRRQHVDRLWAVMRADNTGLAADLAQEWLTRFPDLSGEAEVEMIDRLIRSNRRDALRALLADRQERAPDAERRRNWEAVALIVDFDAARTRLGGTVEPELLWHLRARIGGRRYHDDGEGSPAYLTVEQIVWMIATFRALWPSTSRPGSVTTGDTNPWDASDHIWSLIQRLGNDVSPDAVTAIGELRDAPEDGYTTALRIVAAQQRQKQADEGYTPPTLDQIKAVLDAGPPATVADLRAIVADELAELGRRLRGSSEDEVKLFWTDRGTPRTENECRDRTVVLLRGHVASLSIYPIDEADMPQGKRADVVFYHDALWLPVEAKRQQHPDLWTAIDRQLERFYTGHWQAEGQGLYLVFWFGAQFGMPARPGNLSKPTTAAELQAALDTHAAVKAGRVQVVVLDLSVAC